MSYALVCDTCNRVGLLVQHQYATEPPDGWELRGLATGYLGEHPTDYSWHPANLGHGEASARHRCPLCARQARNAENAKDVRTVVREEVYGIREEIAVALEALKTAALRRDEPPEPPEHEPPGDEP